MELYIHIPFCMKKCEYCDFLSMVSGEKDRQTYVDALCREIAYYGKMHGTERIDTIYIGGGTPSVVGADALIRLLECVKEKFYVNPLAEVTIELNPATIEKDGLHKLREKICVIIPFVERFYVFYAIVAQLVERHLAKVETAGSSPVYRSGSLINAGYTWLSIQ